MEDFQKWSKATVDEAESRTADLLIADSLQDRPLPPIPPPGPPPIPFPWPPRPTPEPLPPHTPSPSPDTDTDCSDGDCEIPTLTLGQTARDSIILTPMPPRPMPIPFMCPGGYSSRHEAEPTIPWDGKPPRDESLPLVFLRF
jgi:hypothetical protein